ncbi:MAG: phosphate propanoyltransferase [Lachnospiraceae bacterium]|nr:phosphate propanoyltransferase [Lachnospiraceae bacterium]
MEKSQYAQEEFLRLVVRLVVEELLKLERSVPIGVSNRHIHLNRADMDTLFGEGSELTRVKDLGQPGQYAAAETVTSRGSKGELTRMRVLGPLRGESQVEVSIGDGFALGVHPPVRESGQLEGTPGVKVIGPNGEVEMKRGVIAALRHIHLDPATAERMGVHDKQIVRVEIGGLRGAILNNVLLRVSDKFAPEMHIDVEEANALGVKNGDRAYIILD